MRTSQMRAMIALKTMVDENSEDVVARDMKESATVPSPRPPMPGKHPFQRHRHFSSGNLKLMKDGAGFAAACSHTVDEQSNQPVQLCTFSAAAATASLGWHNIFTIF
eukprot:SAG31_NODE_12_length_38498_cov_21.161671_25_plen_107_part_00